MLNVKIVDASASHALRAIVACLIAAHSPDAERLWPRRGLVHAAAEDDVFVPLASRIEASCSGAAGAQAAACVSQVPLASLSSPASGAGAAGHPLHLANVAALADAFVQSCVRHRLVDVGAELRALARVVALRSWIATLTVLPASAGGTTAADYAPRAIVPPPHDTSAAAQPPCSDAVARIRLVAIASVLFAEIARFAFALTCAASRDVAIVGDVAGGIAPPSSRYEEMCASMNEVVARQTLLEALTPLSLRLSPDERCKLVGALCHVQQHVAGMHECPS